ncbi:hypothetical protein R1sor_014730 [Riccia sorocarpa]|uniref:Uncharacterized protein n=1 Tax=Riccia sorocarpa TaxID=122646 RepID=A0ABD3HEG6_9MARC
MPFDRIRYPRSREEVLQELHVRAKSSQHGERIDQALEGKEKTNVEARVKELKAKMETISKEKTAALEEVKKKDKKINNLQVQWINRQEVEDKDVILGNLRDAFETIYKAMKEVPMKEKKKISFTQLADQVKGDYENLLKEHRGDFELFKTSLLSETAAPTTSGRSSF